jgi:hypothetical protein
VKVSKLLFALMLAAGATSVAFGPATAEEKKKASPGGSTAEINAQDCKTAGPGDKNKPREKVAAGTAQPGGEIAPEDCKAKPVVKDKTRKEVSTDAKAAAKAGATKGGGGPN